MSAAVGEIGKLGAFLRRDFLVAWSYRNAFVSEWLALALQACMFYFVGRLVAPSVLPEYGGTHATYMQFVSVGMTVTALMQLALGRVASGVRSEQMTGTLESLLLTPTASPTIQLGTVVYDFLYIPIRLTAFLTIMAIVFHLDFVASGILPAFFMLALLLPFVWGIGIANAAGTLTFRRGGIGTGFVMSVLALGSGAFFPLSVLPDAIAEVNRYNPIAISLEAQRRSLIGGEGWGAIDWHAGIVAGCAAAMLVVGLYLFRLALARERRLGSLGLY